MVVCGVACGGPTRFSAFFSFSLLILNFGQHDVKFSLTYRGLKNNDRKCKTKGKVQRDFLVLSLIL